MKNSSDSLRDLFTIKIRALYDIESELVKALPKVAESCTDSSLKAAIIQHLGQTKDHVERIKKIFDLIGERPKKIKVEAIRGLVADTEWVIKKAVSDGTRDAGIIASAQYVEHYEMAGYRSARNWAALLGEDQASELLQETLSEEEAIDHKLNALAADSINVKAGIGSNPMAQKK